MRRVVIVPYDAGWPALAAAEAARFASALAGDPRLVAIHHIGSTAVPGLAAKPILDLLPEVRELACLEDARPALEALGYRWRGEHGLPGRRYCSRDEGGARVAHVHGYASGDPAVRHHLAFRDFLRAHPEVAAAYAAHKRACAAAHADDTEAYVAAKSGFVQQVLGDALAWAAAERR
jgi:GrpB-like predicted nucleotidyltransferase (UPF0157 family)